MQILLLKLCSFLFGPPSAEAQYRLLVARATEKLLDAEVDLCRAQATRQMHFDQVVSLKAFNIQALTTQLEFAFNEKERSLTFLNVP